MELAEPVVTLRKAATASVRYRVRVVALLM
jgi:hypothetical protein